MSESLREKLERLSVPELKKVAKIYNLQKRIAYSRLKKAELVDALHSHLSVTALMEGDEPSKKTVRFTKKLLSKPKLTFEEYKAVKKYEERQQKKGLQKQKSIPLPVDEEDRDQREAMLTRMIAERRGQGKDISNLVKEYVALRTLARQG
jgi:hypothetical protein